MVVRRGELWWGDLPEPAGSEPGFRRPIVIVQADPLNASRISTVVVAAITSNLRLAISRVTSTCHPAIPGLIDHQS